MDEGRVALQLLGFLTRDILAQGNRVTRAG